ncbi:flagellar hook-basal body complex protein FliE [Photobacterium sp. BZF1]|nr:flagellar hook-basal body complex protein FliE [Photobacterium sp. BZF1]
MSDKMAFHRQIATNPLSDSFMLPPTRQVVATESVSGQSLAFGEMLRGVLDTVDLYQSHASEKVTAVELGKSDDLIGATIAAQKAQLSFSALMQVRNKMVSNFEDIIKMPI